ncbi:MAG: type I methionyl aminopeptidase [Candidatus Latescibacteria bacterium]|nr:type I methionyl aminopeptidase [Candidatus Latescibacterota bacterium]
MIARRTPEEIERIRASCQIVYQVQQALEEAVAPGVTTLELDRMAEELIRDEGAVPAFKGYHGFPASICASVNTEIVHGFPRSQPLQEGDIVTIDVGVLLEGYYGDGAFTLGLEPLSSQCSHLLRETSRCLELGIAQARPRGRLSDISHAVQTHAEANGLTVIRDFSGHGIGRALHEEPNVLNYGPPGKGPRLQPGFVLAIEPILGLGSDGVDTAADGWTTTTQDGSLAAHFEHTVAITEHGPEILTLPSQRRAQVTASQ